MYVAKRKVLISYAVTVQLICAFVLAYAKSRFFIMTPLKCVVFQTDLIEFMPSGK